MLFSQKMAVFEKKVGKLHKQKQLWQPKLQTLFVMAFV
jgi:hypothetical protein